MGRGWSTRSTVDPSTHRLRHLLQPTTVPTTKLSSLSNPGPPLESVRRRCSIILNWRRLGRDRAQALIGPITKKYWSNFPERPFRRAGNAVYLRRISRKALACTMRSRRCLVMIPGMGSLRGVRDGFTTSVWVPVSGSTPEISPSSSLHPPP